MKKFIYSILATSVFTSCVSLSVGKYDLELKTASNINNGEKLQTSSLTANNSMVDVEWTPADEMLSVKLTNKTNAPIKIHWDEAVFVNVFGESFGVIHGDIKFAEKEKAQTYTIVANQSYIKDVVLPKDYVKRSTAGTGWIIEPMLPTKDFRESDLIQKGKALIGKTMRLIIPIEFNNTINNYEFTFVVNDFYIVKSNDNKLELEKKNRVR